jgi:hypothetical protein
LTKVKEEGGKARTYSEDSGWPPVYSLEDAMRLITSKIITKPISLEEALKKEVPKVRTLDEILASVKQMKTAAVTPAVVVTAAVKEEPKVETKAEAKVETKVEAKVETKVEVKTAGFEQKAATKPTLKIASSLDFRSWEAQEVADAWKQHGTVEACVKNTTSGTSNPKLYCTLLQEASVVADKVIKAAAAKKTEKTAAKAEAKPAIEAKPTKIAGPQWKKIAKLSPTEKQFVVDFFSKLYGKDYVDALVTDY